MEIDFDKIFKLSVFALNLNRSHPLIKRDTKWLIQFLLMHGYFSIAGLLVIYNIFCYNIKMNNFTDTCKNGVMLIMYIVITYEYCLLIVHQKSLVRLIDNMKRDFELAKTLSQEEQEIVLEYANNGAFVCKQWLLLTGIGTLLFLGKNIVLYVYYYVTDGFRLVPFYDLFYPAFIEERKNEIPMYLITYSIVFYFNLYIIVMYVAFVPLGPIFLLHAGGQLEIVKRRIDQIYYISDDEMVWAKLKETLKSLQYIYRFVDEVKECFMINYELTLKLTSVVIPLGVFEIIDTLKQGEFSIEFMTFVVGGILISSAPCYYSNMLMDKGENIRLALYSCGWERKYNRRRNTTLSLMLMHARRPIAIRTVFGMLSLEALADVFQMAYTIFNLMNCKAARK